MQELAADRFEVVVGDETFDVTLSGDEDLPRATITPGYQPAPGPLAPRVRRRGAAGAPARCAAAAAAPRAAQARSRRERLDRSAHRCPA